MGPRLLTSSSQDNTCHGSLSFFQARGLLEGRSRSCIVTLALTFSSLPPAIRLPRAPKAVHWSWAFLTHATGQATMPDILQM
jgi:hypothetical protein